MPEQTAQGRIVETATEARGGERGPSMVVVLNWLEELKQRVNGK